MKRNILKSEYENYKKLNYLKWLFFGAVVLGTIALGFHNAEGAIDKHFDNQNVMLCKSAKISGNVEYLNKCESYYLTGEINGVQL